MRYFRLLGEYDAETQAFSAFAGPTKASPYTPDENARLIGLRAVVGRTAATTLTSAIWFRLTCNSFKPNSIECACVGSGLQTAPAFPVPFQDFPVDQVVLAGVPITLEGRCIGASDVTNTVLLFGQFDNGQG